MELETVSELARQKFYFRLTFCMSLSPSTAKERSLAGSPAWQWLWGGEEPEPCGSSSSGSRAAARSAVLWQQHKHSPVGDDWLFLISLERHTAASVAQSNKVWAGKKGKKPLLIMKGRSGKGSWQSLYNLLYKKQNENKCLYVLWSKNVKAEVNSLLLI